MVIKWILLSIVVIGTSVMSYSIGHMQFEEKLEVTIDAERHRIIDIIHAFCESNEVFLIKETPYVCISTAVLAPKPKKAPSTSYEYRT